MKTSNNGRQFIESFEGLILQSYDDYNDHIVHQGDVVHGTLTIGYGHTSAAGLPLVFAGQIFTKDQADQTLAGDLSKVEETVNRLVKVPLNQNEFDALVSFEFNTGALGKSSVLTLLNSGDYNTAADHILLYDHASGRVLAGLQRRRQAERTLFLAGSEEPRPTPTKDNNMPISQTALVPTHTTSTGAVISAPLQFPQINLSDIDAALHAIEGYLPTLLTVVGAFYPPAAAFAKFLPLVQVAVQGVDIVTQATGSTPTQAAQAVADTLTPGQTSAPALQ